MWTFQRVVELRPWGKIYGVVQITFRCSMIALWGSSSTPEIAHVSQTHDRWGAIELPVLELITELQQVIIARCPRCSRRSSEFHRFGGAISRAARQGRGPRW
ncbi:hypothetical protein [Nonomuraea sp. NPDC049158]|uniref:hypothetical protein n=1 Tax=Nonomuraea sp. NPDC049158 TaxID=3155649 RepID=UPI0033F9EEAE